MSTQKFVLYDLPSKDTATPKCWSLNPWKIRLALNYKGVEYETQWLEYPDIAPTLKGMGVPPGADEKTPYTIPAVRFPDGTFAMDSKAIYPEIERRYPSPAYPSVPSDDAATQQTYQFTSACLSALAPVVLPIIPRSILSEYSAEYFQRTRKQWFGMSLDELEAQKGGDDAWARSKESFGQAAALLKKNGGPFLLGQQFSWADCIFAGFLHFLKRAVGPEGFKRLEEWPEIIAYYDACGKWLEKDD
ncbi:hypothetical protein S7711_06787 [Stachybotrys chartarum IBT 7711]|uniref:Uncharacterized protein n=1 Tax=Stachybotrys chartarum (strain CBS 109288 / IBT 7711) TaxID=1280523 RepID=A0A084AN62_STACB|nr:hypothetical protein S7711_06787 [Stachybotrys chartarum IBT 7711]KFA47194.1 hypothetical protein S40293_06718 [Stachybotrys chartarum IBT 40293]KFA73258.1 hypothetical protein S40288_08609 [Stachybotrys chartarum IBT 40288]